MLRANVGDQEGSRKDKQHRFQRSIGLEDLGVLMTNDSNTWIDKSRWFAATLRALGGKTLRRRGWPGCRKRSSSSKRRTEQRKRRSSERSRVRKIATRMPRTNGGLGKPS